MIPIEEFKSENKEIRDLCNILGISLNQYTLRHNTIVCELLERFITQVMAHLTHEDRSVYQDLLKQHTTDANKIADKFLGNTLELRRIFNEYNRGWCRKPHKEQDHAKYVEESSEIFRLVCERLNFEEEKIFPMLVGDET
jgi:hemerythrin-like domain-containing protein